MTLIKLVPIVANNKSRWVIPPVESTDKAVSFAKKNTLEALKFARERFFALSKETGIIYFPYLDNEKHTLADQEVRIDRVQWPATIDRARYGNDTIKATVYNVRIVYSENEVNLWGAGFGEVVFGQKIIPVTIGMFWPSSKRRSAVPLNRRWNTHELNDTITYVKQQQRLWQEYVINLEKYVVESYAVNDRYSQRLWGEKFKWLLYKNSNGDPLLFNTVEEARKWLETYSESPMFKPVRHRIRQNKPVSDDECIYIEVPSFMDVESPTFTKEIDIDQLNGMLLQTGTHPSTMERLNLYKK